VTVDRARLWTLPDQPPLLLGAAVSVETARSIADWADGLITVAQSHDHLRRMIDAYRDAGGNGEISLQVHLSYAAAEDEALRIAHEQWRTNVFGPPVSWDLERAEILDAVSEYVPPDAMREHVLVSSDLAQHAKWLHDLADLGFDAVYLHHVGKEQHEFIDAFGAQVLPQLTTSS
jgi:alkanesulfonate monooxygenase SsuD/methylene tetrahydromethanopterin reductase-like flavin-dependent oxidoreductase (luciferase family)